jgi:hypothetical protein
MSRAPGPSGETPAHAIAEAVNRCITAARDFVCDRCVKEQLDLRHLSQVQQIAGALGTTRGFLRLKGGCSKCGKGKLVTMAVPETFTYAQPPAAPEAMPRSQDRGPRTVLYWKPDGGAYCPLCRQRLAALGQDLPSSHRLEVEVRRQERR